MIEYWCLSWRNGDSTHIVGHLMNSHCSCRTYSGSHKIHPSQVLLDSLLLINSLFLFKSLVFSCLLMLFFWITFLDVIFFPLLFCIHLCMMANDLLVEMGKTIEEISHHWWQCNLTEFLNEASFQYCNCYKFNKSVPFPHRYQQMSFKLHSTFFVYIPLADI